MEIERNRKQQKENESTHVHANCTNRALLQNRKEKGNTKTEKLWICDPFWEKVHFHVSCCAPF